MSQNHSSKRPFTVGRALALLPFSLLAIAGCAQIIGLDSYTVGSGGSAGTVSSGGSSGSGSSGRPGGGEAGTPQTGGTAGTSGNSSISGTTGMGEGGEAGAGVVTIPPVVGCDGRTELVLNQNVMQSCILRVSCDPFNPVRSISQCVTNNTQDAFNGERCNLKAKTCADYEACEHKGIAQDDLCPQSKWNTNFCSGTKAVSCTADGAFSSWVDCIGQGGTACGTYPNPSATADAPPLLADCKVPETCTGDQDYVCSTEATPLYEYDCVAGQAYGFKCGDFAYCDTDSSGAAGCYLSAATCSTVGTTCTADNVAKVCAAGTPPFEYDYDCGSVGLKCQVGAANAAGDTNYCLAPGCKPVDVNNCQEFCDGTKLNFCYGGAQVATDCTDYGFANCDTFTTPAGLAYAACIY